LTLLLKQIVVVPDDAAAELAFLLTKVSDISDSYESATERIGSNDEKVSRSACATQSASSCYARLNAFVQSPAPVESDLLGIPRYPAARAV
jgi:hypothetical protein